MSILSARGVPIEEISKLVGHSSITVIESVYRKQIQTTVETGTTAMNDVFNTGLDWTGLDSMASVNTLPVRGYRPDLYTVLRSSQMS